MSKSICMGKFNSTDLDKFEVIEFCGEKFYKNNETNETFEYSEWNNQFFLCPIEKKNLKDFLDSYTSENRFILHYTYDSATKTFTTAERVQNEYYNLTKYFAKKLIEDYVDPDDCVDEDGVDMRMVNALRSISTAINGAPDPNKNVVEVHSAKLVTDEEAPYLVFSYACRDVADLENKKLLKDEVLNKKFKEANQGINWIDGYGDGGSSVALYLVNLNASEIETIKKQVKDYNDSDRSYDGIDFVKIVDSFTVLAHLFDYEVFEYLDEGKTKKFLGIDKPSKSDINYALNVIDSSLEESLKSCPSMLEDLLEAYDGFVEEYKLKPQFTHFNYKDTYSLVIIQDTKTNKTYLYIDHFNSEPQVIELAEADSSQKDAVKINNDYYIIA